MLMEQQGRSGQFRVPTFSHLLMLLEWSSLFHVCCQWCVNSRVIFVRGSCEASCNVRKAQRIARPSRAEGQHNKSCRRRRNRGEHAERPLECAGAIECFNDRLTGSRRSRRGEPKRPRLAASLRDRILNVRNRARSLAELRAREIF